MHHFAFWKTNLPFLSVCVGTVVLPKVPWRREDLCQFVIRHKLPNFMKYQITNWPSVRFPAWKWDCNIWASIRITERARQTQLPTAELARLCHFTPCYSSDTRQGQKTSQTFPIYSWSIYIFTGLDLFCACNQFKKCSRFLVLNMWIDTLLTSAGKRLPVYLHWGQNSRSGDRTSAPRQDLRSNFEGHLALTNYLSQEMNLFFILWIFRPIIKQCYNECYCLYVDLQLLSRHQRVSELWGSAVYYVINREQDWTSTDLLSNDCGLHVPETRCTAIYRLKAGTQ